MITELGGVRLVDGTTLRIVLAAGPEHGLRAEICELLVHKGQPWQWHIEAALDGSADQLETRFYLGVIDGRPVANVMTVEYGGVGVLGHVFTRPEWRQRGIARAVMTCQMADFEHRCGRALVLGTGFESHAYWLYHSFGFRSLEGGFMRWLAGPSDAVEADWFRRRAAACVAPAWQHWPALAFMASCAGRDALGSIAFGAGRIANLEWPYLNLLQQVRQSGWYASILETDEGRAVGCASVTPLRLGDGYRPWPGVWCVDLLIHDAFTDKATDLLGSLALPSGKCLAFVSPSAADKIAALGARGFVREGVLTGMLPAGDVDRDVAIYGLGT